MLIDWFTVGAQVLNFLVLVWLLKRFLYKPIHSAIEAREKRITSERANAEAERKTAATERENFESKSRAFDVERSALLAKAVEQARAQHAHLFEEATAQVEAYQGEQRRIVNEEGNLLGQAIGRLAKEEVFGIARKALADLAAVSLEERMGEVFTRRLREMDSRSNDALAAALHSSSEQALVKSTFDLPGEQKAAIQNALNERFSMQVHVRFETAPETICGIELTVTGQKVGWNVAEYIAALEERVSALLVVGTAAAADGRAQRSAGVAAATRVGLNGTSR